MRKHVILKNPIPMDLPRGDMLRRIMVHDTKDDGVYVFLSSFIEDIGCDSDYWFEDLEEAEEYCRDLGVCQEEWTNIDNPRQDCQQDIIRPVRVNGRNGGESSIWKI